MNEVILSEIFLKIVNMSISASWLVLAVLLLRLVLKKAPKWVSVLLWGFVAVRLICPFTMESVLSLIPSAETVSPEIMMDWTPEISTGIGSVDTVINPIITQTFAPNPATSANPLQILIPVAGILWLTGIAAMLLYTAVSYFLLRRRVATAVLLRNNIYQSENVASPFVLGIIKPKIYLPFRMDGKNLEHVIAHEEAHIRRKDHWWKPFGFVFLALHWFNPLMWLGYILLCRDIELACDEKVIKEMDNENRADYTQALVACSVNRRRIAACPLAFGEVGVKERVKSVMHYRKPGFWIFFVTVVICVVVALCFLTNPSISVDERLSVFIDCQIAGQFQTDKTHGNASCVNWKVLGTKKQGSVTSVYMWVLYEEYSMRNGELYVETGTYIPTLITVKKETGEYKLIEYWEPRDGSFLEPGIREKFPWHLQHKALDSQRYIGKQKEENEKLALDYFLSLNNIVIKDNKTGEIVYGENPDETNTYVAEITDTISTELKTYYALSDGKWLCEDQIYQYRLEISGRMHDAAENSTFVYLSNVETISFDQAWKAAGLSSSTEDYFAPEDAVLVDWLTYESETFPQIGGESIPANGTITDSEGNVLAAGEIKPEGRTSARKLNQSKD